MAIAFKGFGTKYYGEADRRPDGSWVTTEWVVLAHVPILPVATFRLRHNPANALHVGSLHAEGYEIVEDVSMAWTQVGKTYGFVAVTVLWYFVARELIFIRGGLDHKTHPGTVLLVLAVVGLLPYAWLLWMRRKA